MHRELNGDELCRCGHQRFAHEHYRDGADCAQCTGCRRFRSLERMGPQLIATFALLRLRWRVLTPTGWPGV